MLEGKDAGVEMLKFIRAIKAYGRSFNPSFIVIQQNSSELINKVGAPQLQGSVDAIAQEGVWWDGDAIDDEWDNERISSKYSNLAARFGCSGCSGGRCSTASDGKGPGIGDFSRDFFAGIATVLIV